ncbi:hypothetical protein AB0442_39820 [Kitasatospora sp. NPDC085895]|uniref:hypothetical protein n=1 Tax=Kitasatospora sp. NPDC085895 TaxID=3155057 RepID=UPI00344DA0B8
MEQDVEPGVQFLGHRGGQDGEAGACPRGGVAGALVGQQAGVVEDVQGVFEGQVVELQEDRRVLYADLAAGVALEAEEDGHADAHVRGLALVPPQACGAQRDGLLGAGQGGGVRALGQGERGLVVDGAGHFEQDRLAVGTGRGETRYDVGCGGGPSRAGPRAGRGQSGQGGRGGWGRSGCWGRRAAAAEEVGDE